MEKAGRAAGVTAYPEVTDKMCAVANRADGVADIRPAARPPYMTRVGAISHEAA
jgi:hypothetical protein